jgi:hypothetical protein
VPGGTRSPWIAAPPAAARNDEGWIWSRRGACRWRSWLRAPYPHPRRLPRGRGGPRYPSGRTRGVFRCPRTALALKRTSPRSRHCEERKRRGNPWRELRAHAAGGTGGNLRPWIAAPPSAARNDEGKGLSAEGCLPVSSFWARRRRDPGSSPGRRFGRAPLAAGQPSFSSPLRERSGGGVRRSWLRARYPHPRPLPRGRGEGLDTKRGERLGVFRCPRATLALKRARPRSRHCEERKRRGNPWRELRAHAAGGTGENLRPWIAAPPAAARNDEWRGCPRSAYRMYLLRSLSPARSSSLSRT